MDIVKLVNLAAAMCYPQHYTSYFVIGGMKMENNTPAFDGLTGYERETIINYNNAEDTANVFTLNQSMRRKMLLLAEQYPDDVKIIRQAEDMVELTIPKKWVKVSPPRQLTDEQRAELVERGRQLAAKYSFGKKASSDVKQETQEDK